MNISHPMRLKERDSLTATPNAAPAMPSGTQTLGCFAKASNTEAATTRGEANFHKAMKEYSTLW
jgi:hypothetical protein